MHLIFPRLVGGLFVVFVAALFLTSDVLACSGQTVVASWYGPGFHGKKTASGERFDQNAMTAAHKTMKFGTRLRVTYRGKSVTVRITDRGPFVRGRSIDLSKAAAQRIGLIGPGHGRVCIEKV